LTWTINNSISPTAVSDYEECPRKFYHRSVARDCPFQESKQLVWGRAAHKAIERRCGPGRYPLPENMKEFEEFCEVICGFPIIITERKFGMTWEGVAADVKSPDCAVQATGDITIMTADGKTATTVDVKTGKPREDPFQLQMQALVLMAHYPSLQTVKGAYYWTQQARLGPIYDLTDCWEKTMDRLIQMADRVDELTKLPIDPNRFATIPGDPFPCNYCNAPCEYAKG
jgi:CRISPR/Cas system-associated exonuclease Cas4 (RecB family)